ncbi:MAG: hypothetical protein EA397_16240 [Deltaproteobacteria bacterium]|nr:MAG: hypothetical protein EA397_16240 [Deltaproteobacteria bacterium]
MVGLIRSLRSGWSAGLLGLLLFASPSLAQEGPSASAPPPTELRAHRGAEVPAGWHTLQGEHLRMHTSERHLRLGQALLDHADPRVPELSERLGWPGGPPIDVFLATSDAEFRRIQPGTPPGWADATAYPGLGAVYLRAPQARGGDRDPLTRVLDHELVHIVVGRAFAPDRAPTWLQEGLAQLHAGQHDLHAIRKLAGAAVSGPIPLDQLERAFPKNPHAASLAYAQSVDFLVWLEREYGDEAVPELVERLRRGESLPDAILAVTGEPLHEVDRRWTRRFTGVSGAVWSVLGSPDFMWLLAALIGVAAMFVVRFRQRQRRAVIRSRERKERELLGELWTHLGQPGSPEEDRRRLFSSLDHPSARESSD